MLTTQKVEIPSVTAARLRDAANLVDNIMDFARDDLVGFKRPLAATFAMTTPILSVLAYSAGGWRLAIETTLLFCACAFFALYLVGRCEWPRLVDSFENLSVQKRRAVADLRCGFGEESFLRLGRAPVFYEHENGVLVFADVGDFRTLFMSLEHDERDPRWVLYLKGDLSRRVWRWLRLPVSRELVRFSTVGSKIQHGLKPRWIPSVDSWDAIHAALDDPQDGAIIHRQFDEITELVERML